MKEIVFYTGLFAAMVARMITQEAVPQVEVVVYRKNSTAWEDPKFVDHDLPNELRYRVFQPGMGPTLKHTEGATVYETGEGLAACVGKICHAGYFGSYAILLLWDSPPPTKAVIATMNNLGNQLVYLFDQNVAEQS